MIISGTAGRHEAAVLTVGSSEQRAETGNNVISPRFHIAQRLLRSV
jgi:hypothetical protein